MMVDERLHHVVGGHGRLDDLAAIDRRSAFEMRRNVLQSGFHSGSATFAEPIRA